jgi:hypothetical protein
VYVGVRGGLQERKAAARIQGAGRGWKARKEVERRRQQRDMQRQLAVLAQAEEVAAR